MNVFIPLIGMLLFLGTLILINRKNLGVKDFSDYASSHGAFNFIFITLAVLATWFVGSSFTAFAQPGVRSGVTMDYVTPYATFCIVTMLVFSERTWVWGKRYGLVTQADLIGYRYQSKWLQLFTGLSGIAFVAPWLMLEWVVQGYIFHYATGGLIPTSVGMIVGAAVVLIYVSLGGMRSVITANFLQGIIGIFGGTVLFIWIVYRFYGGIGELYQAINNVSPEFLTYPGPGSSTPIAGWTSMVMASALGAWTWPWAFNKTYAASGVRELKKTALAAPICGGIFWTALTIMGNMGFLDKYVYDNPNEIYVYFAREAGIIPLTLMSIIIMAISVGTVSGMVHGMSASVARDVAPIFKKQISNETSIKIARLSVAIIAIICILWGIFTGDDPTTLNIVLITYQGIIQLFPPILFGLFWRRASKQAATLGFAIGTILAMYWNIKPTDWMISSGWSGGMIAVGINFVIMIVVSLFNRDTTHADKMFTEFAIIKAIARSKRPQVAR
jgi:Na+/proline symporter